jgi:phosphoserine phosphatase RsbU/P
LRWSWVRAETQWTLAAVGITTAVAVADALLGARLVLIGLLIAGPMLAAIRLDGPRTGLVAAYALGLAVALRPVDHIWGTADHLVRCLVVAVGRGFATAIAFSRSGRARQLAQITRVAEVAQRAILRPIPARLGAMRFATYYLPAAEEALLGGDFYDTAFTPHGLRLITGDVCGKGLPAVQLASVVLGCFREAAFAEADLGGLVAALDRRVSAQLGEEDFVTVVLVEFGPQGWLRLVNCGHPPPLLVQPTGAGAVGAPPASPSVGPGSDPGGGAGPVGARGSAVVVHGWAGGGASGRRAPVRAGRPGGGLSHRGHAGPRPGRLGGVAVGPRWCATQ